MIIAIKAACRDKPLSAAVVADPASARRDKAQDWVRWVNNQWMDFVVPMAYNFPPLELESRAVIYNRMVGKDRWLMGLGVFDGRDEYPRNPSNSASRHHRLRHLLAQRARRKASARSCSSHCCRRYDECGR
jgi:hypothetical protein